MSALWRRVSGSFGTLFGGISDIDLGGNDGAVMPFGGDDALFTAVSQAVALRMPTVLACVELRSSTIASLPLHLRTADKKVDDTSPLSRVLRIRPNDAQNAYSFWQTELARVDVHGNSYSKIVRDNDKIVALIPFQEPENTTVKVLKSGSVRYLNGDKDYAARDVFHLKGFSMDGYVGLSRLDAGRNVLSMQRHADESAARNFRQSMKAGGFFEMENNLTPEQRKDLKLWLDEYSKPENQGKWMALMKGMKPWGGTTTRLSPEAVQLLTSRQFGIEEICRLFRTPPQLIGHTDKASSWASSLENTNLFFLTYALRPTLIMVEQSIKTQLMSSQEAVTLDAKYSVDGLLRVSTKDRYAAYASGLQNGHLSQNEVRDFEDKPGIGPEGDIYRVQLNMAKADKTSDNDDNGNADGVPA